MPIIWEKTEVTLHHAGDLWILMTLYNINNVREGLLLGNNLTTLFYGLHIQRN